METRMLAEIRELFEYDRWANARLLDAVERLEPEQFTRDMGSSFSSVRDTLAHILAAEWVWLERWSGRSPTGPPAWDVGTVAALRERLRQVEADLAAYVDGLEEADLDRVVEYRNTKGDPFAGPLGQMLRHIVNHSTYHRGQVVTMLRQLGAAGVTTDLIAFYRERSPAAEPSG